MVDLSPVRIKALIALSDFTQLVFLASREVPPASIDELIAETRRTYKGPLEVGLMCLEIGETITVHKMKVGRIEYPLLALSGRRLVRFTCPLLTQSGHEKIAASLTARAGARDPPQR